MLFFVGGVGGIFSVFADLLFPPLLSFNYPLIVTKYMYHPYLFYCRLHNKKVYVQMSLKKMVNKHTCKDLQRCIRMEVDGKLVDLPPVEGIIILNILR